MKRNTNGVLFLAGCLAGFSANAQLPVAKLSSLFPPGAKIGSSADMSVSGADLSGLRQAFFSHSGITGKASSDGKKISMAVAKDVPEGFYRAWVVGNYGASNPRTVHVTPLNEVISTTTNHDFDKAQVVATGSVVSGHADKETVDLFKVSLKKGQQLAAQCYDKNLDSQLAGVLTLFNGNRREIKRAMNENPLTHTATGDETIYLQVNDRVFRGGTDYFYRLKISTAGHADFVMPLAVKAGAAAKVKLHDVTGKAREIAVTAPAWTEQSPAGVTLLDYQATVTGFGVGGNIVGFAEAPVVVEASSNDAATKPQSIKLPCDISGRFFPARDRDYYTFDAKKGEVYWVEIISHRLGVPTDPMVVIQKVDKKAEGAWAAKDVLTLGDADRNFGGVDFNTFHRDDDARFEVKEDGSYRIMVRDLFNGVRDEPNRVYRLVLRKERPDYLVVAQPVPRKAKGDRRDVWRSNTLLRQGDVEALNVLVFRKDGFREEISIEVEGLPVGVSHAPLKFSGSTKAGMLMLRAAETAKQWSGPVRVLAKAKMGGKPVVREARIANANWDIDYSSATTEAAQVRLSDRLVIAVTDEASPLELIPAAAKPIEVVVGTKVTVPVKVARRGEFNADLKVKPYGHSSLAKVPDSTVKKDSGSVVIDLKKYKLPEGTHQLHLKTNSKGNYRPASKELKIAQAEAKSAAAVAGTAEKHAKALLDVTKVKGLTAGQIAAVKKEADEAAKVAKDLVAKRDAAQKKAKDLAAKVKPKALTVDFYSMPFLVTVKKK